MAFKAGAIYGEAKLDTSNWDSGIKKIGTSAVKVGKVAGAAFVAAMTVSIAKANEFQKSMANVSTVIDTSAVSTQDLTKSLLTMDPALGATTELTNALYQTFSAGAGDAEEAMATTVAAAKFGKAALTDTATAVDVLTTASNAYGSDLVSTTQASDIFFTTIKQGKITGEQLATTIGKSIPLFASMNIPLEELGSGMAAMTKQGVSASEATTQLNGIVNSFLSPSAALTEALNEQGIASGAALLESEGLSGALEFLENASGGSAAELSNLLPSIEAVRGTLALTGVGGKEFASILDEMESAAGATDVAFGKQEMTFETLKNQMDKVAVVSGNIGKHFVDELAGGATEAAGAMLTFITSSSGMETIGNLVGAVSGTFDLLKTAVVPIVELLSEEWSKTIAIVSAEIEEMGFMAGDGAGAFDILGYVVAGVTSVIRVASVATGEFIGFLGDLVGAVLASGETVGNFFSFLTGNATWADVKSSASEAKDAFLGLATGVGDSFSAIAETVTEEVESFSSRGAKSAVELESSFTLAFDRTKTNVEDNWDEMITGQADFVNDMLEANSELVSEMKDQNDELEEDAEVTTGNILDYFKNLFTEASFGWAGLYDTATASVTAGLSGISDITSQFYTNEAAEIELWEASQLAAIESRYSEGLTTEEEYEAEVAALEAAALEKENALALKQFESEKALNLAGVAMDTAASIAGWWSAAPSLGPVAGPIFAGVMTAASLGMGVTQAALISQEQFVPAYANGGMASGTVQVNEQGGEIITLPDGSQVIPNDISQQIASSSGNTGTVVNFYDTVISDNVDIDSLTDEISRKIAQRMRIA